MDANIANQTSAGMTQRNSIADHLAKYGLQLLVSNNEFRTRCHRELSQSQCKKLEARYRRMEVKKYSAGAELKFYEFCADPKIGGIVHSWYADQLRVAGNYVTGILLGAGRILDVGCGLGYLTTWYALQNPNAAVVGIDYSPQTIQTALKLAENLQVTNVTFLTANLTQYRSSVQFDAIVNVRAISHVPKHCTPLKNIRRLLSTDGIFLTIEGITSAQDAQEYWTSLVGAGLIVTNWELIHYSFQGRSELDTAVTCRTVGSPISPDFVKMYMRSSKQINL